MRKARVKLRHLRSLRSRHHTEPVADTVWERWRFLPRLVALLWSVDRRDMVLIAALAGAAGLWPLVTVILLRGFIDSSVMMVQRATPLDHTLLWLGGLVLANMAFGLVGLLNQSLNEDSQARLQARVQQRLLVKAGRLRLADFEQPHRFDQLHQASRSLDTHLMTTLHALTLLPANVLTIVSLTLYLTATNGWLPFVLIIGLTPGALLLQRYYHARYHQERTRTSTERLGDYVRNLIIERPAAAEIRLFGLQAHLSDWQQELRNTLRNDRLGLVQGEARVNMLGSTLTYLTLGLVMLGGVVLVMLGRLSVGHPAAYLAAFQQFTVTYNTLFWAILVADGDLRYVRDLLNYLDLPEEPFEDRSHQVTEHPSSPPTIHFKNVSFTYPGSERPVLDDITLTLHPGERIALVGENGAGKTTLAKLLLGLYRPTTGHILVDGIALEDTTTQHWRTQVGAVFQDYVRYEVSVRENIAFGDLHRIDELDAIQKAAEDSGASTMVERLPRNYGTILGKSYDETGTDLSSGQWQKLAIARAYLRDAPIVVLDEPAAALDPLAEVEVYRQFRDVSNGRSVLLISHRLGSARLADRIIVLAGGRIVEAGSHAELVVQGGHYADMYRMQAAWYR